MSFSLLLHKWWRTTRKLLRSKGNRDRCFGDHGNVLQIRDVRAEAGVLTMTVIPSLPVIDIVVQMSTGEGRVLLNHAIKGKSIPIAPSQPIKVELRLDDGLLDVEPCTIYVEASQGPHQACSTLVMTAKGENFRIGYPSIENFLSSVSLNGAAEFELLPRGRAELVSLMHMSDMDFLRYCYFWLLGRDADQDGLDHYLSALSKGMTRQKLITDMSLSKESSKYRRSSTVAVSGQGAYPFSKAHDRMRQALGATTANEEA